MTTPCIAGTYDAQAVTPACAVSTLAVDCDFEGAADFVHARVCQSTESRDEQGDRDAFDGIQVHG